MVAVGQLLAAVVLSLVVVAAGHRLGSYPASLPRIDRRRRELIEVGVLLSLNLTLAAYAALAYRGLAPSPAFLQLDGRRLNPVVVLLGPVVTVGVPLVLEAVVHGRSPADLGLRRPVAIIPAVALVGLGIGQGVSALDDATAVAPVALLFGLYNPAFEEEFLVRGVIQSKLERVGGPVRAWVGSGLAFGALHVPNTFVGVFWLSTGGDVGTATLVLARQTAFGLLVAVLYAQSRSLLAPVLAHYFANDMGELLATLLAVGE